MASTPADTEDPARLSSAGQWARVPAFLVDAALFAHLPCVSAVLFGLYLPLDDPKYFSYAWLCGALLGHGYFAMGYAVFANSIGKRLWGLHVVSIDGGPVPWWRWLLRYASYFILPISFLYMVIADGQGRHLGDRWARTRVLRRAMPMHIGLRIGLTIALLWGVVTLSRTALRFAASNTEAYQVAVQHVLAQRPHSPPPGWPKSSMLLLEDFAGFAIEQDDGRRMYLKLSFVDGSWRVTSMEPKKSSSSSHSIVLRHSPFGRIHIVAP